MATLLLICDEYIYKHNEHYYAGSQERLDFLSRYIRVFDKMKIALRCIEEKELKSQRVIIDNPKIDVVPISIFHGPKEYFQNYIKIGKELKDVAKGCDAAVLRLPSTVAQRAYKYIMKAGIPYATEIVFDAKDGEETSDNRIQRVLWHIIDKKMKYICHNADGVSCVTEHYLQRRYKSSKAGHFESHYSTLSLPRAFFTGPRTFDSDKVKTIAHVDLQIGLQSRKGTKEVIDALSLLKQRGIIVNAKFAGDDWDNSTKAIMDYAEEKGVHTQINCPGLLTRSQLSDFLEMADLFVLPTRAEGLPRVIIEAIAKGLPVVTTPASGNPELIPDHFLVNYSDVKTLANRIEELVINKKVYEEASKTNFDHSLNYEGSLLEKRRDVFYTNLKNKCK